MKSLTKILTVATLAVLGTMAWASAADVAELQGAHEDYMSAQTDDELEEALGNLQEACESSCNRVSCRLDGDLAETCATSCPYDNVQNCVRAWDSTLKTSKDVKAFLSDNGITIDRNGVPGAPTTRVTPKKKAPKKRSMFDRARDTFSSASTKVKSAVSGAKSKVAKAVGGEDGSCICDVNSSSSEGKGTTPQPQVGKPVAPVKQAPAPGPVCLPDDAAAGLC